MYSHDKLLRALEHAPVKPFDGFVYRVIPERWRESPLSAIGSIRVGGRYNAPNTFTVLYWWLLQRVKDFWASEQYSKEGRVIGNKNGESMRSYLGLTFLLGGCGGRI